MHHALPVRNPYRRLRMQARIAARKWERLPPLRFSIALLGDSAAALADYNGDSNGAQSNQISLYGESSTCSRGVENDWHSEATV